MEPRKPLPEITEERESLQGGSGASSAGPDAAFAILYANGDLVLQRGPEPDGSPGHAAADCAGGPWAVREDGAYENPPRDGFDDYVSRDVYDTSRHVPWYPLRSDVRSVAARDRIYPRSTAWWFCGLSRMAEADLALLDMSRAESAAHMFDGCGSLASLDVSGWDVSGVQDMNWMFRGCRSLATLDVSSWDVSEARNMLGMFLRCESLTSLDVSKWDVSHVKAMNRMFQDCKFLAFLDLSGWAIQDESKTEEMFSGCRSLATLRASPSFVASPEMCLPEGVRLLTEGDY